MIDHDKHIALPMESRRTFDYKGLNVEERIYKEDDHFKMVWCLHPFESTVKDGVVNPTFHVEFVKMGGSDETEARIRCQSEFEKYWFDGEQVTSRNLEQYGQYTKELQGTQGKA